MGRKSLAPQRREELLDAAEACIAKHGLAGASLERMGDEAGVHRTLIHHYLGRKDDVVEAVIARMVMRHQQRFREAMDGLPDERRLSVAMDWLAEGKFTALEHWPAILTELYVASHRDESAKQRLLDTYALFEEVCITELRRAFPDAPEELCRCIAYGVMCLADGSEGCAQMGFDENRRVYARRSIEVLLDGLRQRDAAQEHDAALKEALAAR